MRSSPPNSIQGLFRRANRWFQRTPKRALNDAYEAAIAIKSIEDNHFGGNKIAPESGDYSQNVYGYFSAQLASNLRTIRVRLTEFRLSDAVIRTTQSGRNTDQIEVNDGVSELQTVDISNDARSTLRKLKFIDQVLSRYRAVPNTPPEKDMPPQQRRGAIASQKAAQSAATSASANGAARILSAAAKDEAQMRGARRAGQKRKGTSVLKETASITDKTGVLPRSILRTVDRITRELDPASEDDVVDEFRDSKARTAVSLRFILLLIIVPLLTHQVSKNFIVGPIIDTVRPTEETAIFINDEMEEEAIHELNLFRERLQFERLIGEAPDLTNEAIDERVKEKAEEIEFAYRRRSGGAIKNVFADILSVLAFVTILSVSKREIAILKSFIDEVIYGLSDSAKAFIIILLTDTFVGFHSPHGWEVILEGVARHFGLPASRDFIFIFIATFPVILDTVFKYWIFRYLNRISPSAVSTYKTMNE
ncbi:MAG: proton extrusion protein PcxA [Elainellaceae cyanobacterium]